MSDRPFPRDMDGPLDRVRGVVIDAVGTLIIPHPTVSEAYAMVARGQGIALDPGDVAERFRRVFQMDESRERNGPLTTDEGREAARWRSIVAGVLPELPDPARGFEELWEHFGRPGAWRCFPDVPGFLERLRRSGLPVRVASNFDGRLRRVVAGLPELSGLAESLRISSEIGWRKPHPEFYRRAAEGLSPDGPSSVLWVGDDVENDVLGPRAAGFASVHLDRHERGGGVAPRVADLRQLDFRRADDRV